MTDCSIFAYVAAFLQVLHKNSKFCEFTAPQQKINLGAYNSARSSSLHPVAEHGRRCSIPASHMRCSGNVLALSQPQPPSSGLCFSLAPARSSALALVGLTLHSSPFCILALCWGITAGAEVGPRPLARSDCRRGARMARARPPGCGGTCGGAAHVALPRR